MGRKREVIQLIGVDCYTCKLPVEKSVGKIDGVIQIHINPLTDKALVEYDSDVIDIQTIKKSILKTGYKVMGMPETMVES
jgi:copper chaperone CopZ